MLSKAMSVRANILAFLMLMLGHLVGAAAEPATAEPAVVPTKTSNTAGANNIANIRSDFIDFQLNGSQRGTEARYTLVLSSRDQKGNENGSGGKTIKPSVFVLESPSRLVVDLVGFPSLTARNVTLDNNSGVVALRVGAHKDKTRLVIDIAGVGLPTYEIGAPTKDRTGRLQTEVRFSIPTGSLAAPAEPVPSPTEPPAVVTTPPPAVLPPPDVLEAEEEDSSKAPTRPDLYADEKILDSVPAVPAKKIAIENEPKLPENPPVTAPKPLDAKEPAAASPVAVNSVAANSVKGNLVSAVDGNIPTQVVPAPTQEDAHEIKFSNSRPSAAETKTVDTAPVTAGGGKVTGLLYQVSNSSGALAVRITGIALDDFKLTRTKPTLYELEIRGAQLGGNHLSLPQFPPDNFHGFEAISAIQQGNDALVRIFVEDGIKLAPLRIKGDLWVEIKESQ